MNTLTYSTENHEFKYLGRYSHFSGEVKNYFGEISEGMAICHGISFKCIAYAITLEERASIKPERELPSMMQTVVNM